MRKVAAFLFGCLGPLGEHLGRPRFSEITVLTVATTPMASNRAPWGLQDSPLMHRKYGACTAGSGGFRAVR